MRLVKTWCVVVVAFILVSSISAEEGNGGQAAAFLNLSLAGRPAAMGGAFTAIADGSIGHLFNPAGVANTRKYSSGFSYRLMEMDRRLGFASIIIPARDNAALAFSWIHAGSADLDARDEQGNIISGQVVSHNENLIGMTFGKRFIPQLMAGGKIFYAQNNIATINSYTVGINLGVLYKQDMRKTFLKSTFPLLQAGVTLENLGASYKWTTTNYWNDLGRDRGATFDENFPTNFRVGLALINLDWYLLTADLEINNASMTRLHLGGEYKYGKTLALRAGLDDSSPTAGIGLFKKFDSFGLWIDLAYLSDRVGEGDDILVSFELMF